MGKQCGRDHMLCLLPRQRWLQRFWKPHSELHNLSSRILPPAFELSCLLSTYYVSQPQRKSVMPGPPLAGWFISSPISREDWAPGCLKVPMSRPTAYHSVSGFPGRFSGLEATNKDPARFSQHLLVVGLPDLTKIQDANKWIKKSVVCIYNGTLLTIKMNEILPCATVWMDVETKIM